MHLSHGHPYLSIAGLVTALLLLLTACSSPSPTATATKPAATPMKAAPATSVPATVAPTAPAAQPTATQAPPTSTPVPVTLAVKLINNAKLGDIIADTSGKVLYARDGDTTTNITCTAACLNTWPIVSPPEGNIGAAAGVTGKVEVITRPEGTKQIALGGKPLYYFVREGVPSDGGGAGLGRFFTLKGDGTLVSISLQPTPTPVPGAVLKITTNAKLGDIVTDINGKALYARDGDTATAITCTGACLNTWPVYTAPEGNINAPAAITAKLEVITRPEGTKQIALGGRPLYYFVREPTPSDGSGAGLGRFFALKADGSLVSISLQPTPTPVASFPVGIANSTFQNITVPKGTMVVWTNKDSVPHTITSGSGGKTDGKFDSGTLDASKTFSLAFSQTGTFPYTCAIHPSLNATVTVTESGPSSSSPATSTGSGEYTY